ncbi:MAG: amidohydrolase [Anaerolineae bacterium]|nr:amidohydrolase [Anaerolineae bacterium]
MKAELILHNAKIYTLDPTRPWAEAVACANGRIIAVGRNEEIKALARLKTKLVDAQQQLVLPGLIDAHVHLLQYAIRRHQVNLFGVSDVDGVREKVRQAVAGASPGQWIQGWGWDERLWASPPHRHQLDDIAPHNPVVLARMDMHTWWVNSAALAQAGISAHTPNPPDSYIERDATGEPTGLLREWNAIRLVEQYIVLPDGEMLEIWLREAVAAANRFGLTGIHDQRVEQEGELSLQLFQALNRQGQLNLRVHHHLAANYLAQAMTLGLQAGFGDDRLWLGHVKTFADGTMGSRTALMLEPFEGEKNNRGIAVTSVERLRQLARQANQIGFPLSVHAIGDRAVREVISILGENPPENSNFTSGLPHRIEHVQLIHPDDLPRLGRANIFASVQPVHLLTDWPTADRVWGQRTRYTYAFRSLLEHGTQLAFGSDAPVAPLNPMLGIYAAVTRQDEQGQPAKGWYPEERLTVAEAIYGYTLGPAKLAGKQHRQGSISSGKWADMIVLSRNILEIPPNELAEVAVKLTIFDGRVVYQAE